MGYPTILLFFVLIYTLNQCCTWASGISENIRKCCNLGRTQAAKLYKCDLAYAVTDIAPVWRGLCHSTYGLCCTYDLEKIYCTLGRNAALAGTSCILDTKNTTTAYRDCCRACQLGLAVKVSGSSCHDPLFDYFTSIESFQMCCMANESVRVMENHIYNSITSEKTFIHGEKDLSELNGTIVLSNDDDDICGKIRLCEQICINTKESYRCKCYPGYKLSSNMITCEPTNSLSVHDNGDEHDVTNAETQILENVTTCPKTNIKLRLEKCQNVVECLHKCKHSQYCLDEINYHCLNGYNEDTDENKVHQCIKGFELKNGHCVDINECATDNEAPCDSNQLCVNDLGDFHCICKVGFILDPTINACVDVNECSVNNHNCLESQRCDNTYGSYVCTRIVACGTGYTLNADSGVCTDNDECSLGTHNCKVGYKCHNTKGSFRCYRTTIMTNTTTTKTKTTSMKTTTVSPLSNSSYYQYRQGVRNPLQLEYLDRHISGQHFQPEQRGLSPCDVGFHRNHLGACVDINECHSINLPCGSHQRCINSNGSYRCENLLKCSAGFISNPEGTQCLDIDECSNGEHNCLDGQICQNRRGGFTCSCLSGYQVRHPPEGTPRCMDVNECARIDSSTNQMLCPSNSQCINTQGSYFCECKPGFQKSMDESIREHSRLCLDVDECNDIPGLCQQKCLNFFGGYRCTCMAGYELSVDNRTCNDVDECTVQRSYQLCMGYCNNVPGSYECSCPRGYTLASDHFTCIDIDECADGTVCTGYHDVCTNTRGSYKCITIVCPPGYNHNPDQKTRCQLSKPCEDDECYTKPLTYTHNFISLVSNLMVPIEGRTIFNLRGPAYYDIDFNDLKIVRTICPANVEKATYKHFSTIKDRHEIHLSLKHPLEGPQEIELELAMTVFTRGLPRGRSVAKIYILVSQYSF